MNLCALFDLANEVDGPAVVAAFHAAALGLAACSTDRDDHTLRADPRAFETVAAAFFVQSF